MFMLTTLQDRIRIDPADLGALASVAIEQRIRHLYCDRVVHEVGLVISLYDLLSFDGGDVFVGDGGVAFDVEFRMVVFHPFEGEVLLGRISHSSPQGISVSLGFFEDAFIPEQYMQSPGSMYEEASQTWFWKYPEAEDTLYLTKGETVRFRVREVQFERMEGLLQDGSTGSGNKSDEQPVGSASNPFKPMKITGDIDGDGLGCVSWWDDADDGEEAMEE